MERSALRNGALMVETSRKKITIADYRVPHFRGLKHGPLCTQPILLNYLIIIYSIELINNNYMYLALES